MKSLNILVIDDRQADIEHAAALLYLHGHAVIAARDGEEGVQLAATEHPDLILMDVVMPKLNGFQATRELSRNAATRDIPVVMVSCKDEVADRVWAMKQGARAYLAKGYDEQALLDAIDCAMAATVVSA